MPRGDQTGPFGDGPRTGRAMGFCSGNTSAGFVSGGGRRARGNRGVGCGMGRGFGRNRGRGRCGFNRDSNDRRGRKR